MARVGLAVDPGRLGIGRTADLGRLPPGFGGDLRQFPVHPAEDFGLEALAGGALLRRDPLAFGNHPVIHLEADRLDVVDPLEHHVHQFDAVLRGDLRGGLEHHVADPVATDLGRRHQVARLDGGGHEVGGPVGTADDLDQVVLVDQVAHRAVEDVAQQGHRPPFGAHGLEETQRVDDAPARRVVHVDEGLVVGRDLVGITVPDKDALVEILHLLDDRQLELETGSEDRLAHRPAELGDDRLLALAQDVETVPDGDSGHGDEADEKKAENIVHAFLSVE